MTRDQVVEWLAGYPPTFGPPVREHTPGHLADRARRRRLRLDRHRPRRRGRLGGGLGRRRHRRLPHAGRAGVGERDRPVDHPARVGALQERRPAPRRSRARRRLRPVGAQIAEDLHLAGRQVHLALGNAPRVARFYRGKDVMTWLAEMGLYDTPVQQYPGGLAAREKTNHYVTGRDGGRDIDLRQFAAEGMRLYGYLDARPRHAAHISPHHAPKRSTRPTPSTTRSAATSTATWTARASTHPPAAATSRSGLQAARRPDSTWRPRASRRSSGRSATAPTTAG